MRLKKSKVSVDYKSQASIEYLIVVGFSLFLILSISYYFFFYKTTADKDVLSSQINSVGTAMIKNAEDIYFSTGVTKKQLDLNFPLELQHIYTEDNNKALILELDNGQKTSFDSKAPVYVLNFGSQKSIGLICEKKISVGPTEAILICLVDSEPCDCQESAIELNCTDYNDNDLDGKIDGQDSECCVDNDGDGYTGIEGGYNPGFGVYCNLTVLGVDIGISADDCNDTDSLINPDATELCNGIDENCNGITDDLYGCNGFGMGDDDRDCEVDVCTTSCEGGICMDTIQTDTTECRPGSAQLIIMSDTTNAHVVGSGIGPDNSEYSLCYSTNPGGYCPMECKTVSDNNCNPNLANGVCDTSGVYDGWTKIFSYNQTEAGGSPIIDFSVPFARSDYSSYPQQVLCNASCGTIKCRVGDGTSNSCPSGYTCIISQDIYANTGSHLSECGTLNYNNSICCKIDYS